MKHRGRYKLVHDLSQALVKNRIVIGGDFEELIKNILAKKYQDNKFYSLDEKI